MRKLECPDCGATLSIKDDDREFAFCEYCGTKIDLIDYRSVYTKRIVDEAAIKKEKTREQIRLREIAAEERKDRRRTFARSFVTVILTLGGAFLIGCGFFIRKTDNFDGGFLIMFGVGLLLFAGITTIEKQD